jgi:hypothetical protein
MLKCYNKITIHGISVSALVEVPPSICTISVSQMGVSEEWCKLVVDVNDDRSV